MKIEKVFVNVLNFIPDTIIQKRTIKLSISEEELDKYIDNYAHDVKHVDTSIFKQLLNGIDLNTGDTIVYKGKIFDVNIIETPDDSYKFIILKAREEKPSENKENI